MRKGKDILLFKGLRGICEDYYYISQTANIGGYSYVGNYSVIENNCRIVNALIGRYCYLEQGVVIGEPALHENLVAMHPFFSRNSVKYFDRDSPSFVSPKKYYYENNPLVSIGSWTKICTGACVLAGVNIGRGVLIYPNSVVTEDVPDYAVVAGNPAVIIGFRFEANVRDKLTSLRIEDCSLNDTYLTNDDVNFGDVDELKAIEADIKKSKVTKIRYDNLIGFKKKFISNTIVIGPSHVSKWIALIQQKSEGLSYPKFELYGQAGLSLFSKSIANLVNFWLKIDINNSVLLMVPDFRIGNSMLISKEANPRFIYKKAMAIEGADNDILRHYYNVLDDFKKNYGGRIKFCFWCQYGRQKINIKQGRHVDPVTGEYKHIITNEILKNKYKDNILDIPERDDFFSLIQKDGTVHPTVLGYVFLNELFDQN